MQPITNNQCTNNTIMKQISKDELFAKIVKALKPLNPVKIIVFGSYAYGTPNTDSDIDLYIVTNDDFMPKTWREKNEIYKKHIIGIILVYLFTFYCICTRL